MGTRKELQEYGTAITNGWNITPEMKEMILAECMRVITESTKPREKIRAVETLTKMNQQNIDIQNAEKAKINLNISAPYESMTESANDTIIDSIVSDALDPPQAYREISPAEFFSNGEDDSERSPERETEEPAPPREDG